ncbi:deoxyuridine 5'-triphosphate nucleotidohydrolase [Tricharina praecox]|uniref:deoxyuridine 5'-triphosphate nucleotidohydrolase n=1 Tax=Tricharina praecox TaxID=43433 RepID=UPI00221E9170|nr:deoxyuridine 5'-triphosphate nucleotidohydrolase [Tricharina praecox]KAI5846971.1 deoxyuridine 5'-triphosphate nucleotidohydrolase [Tricharina praecox]
MSTTAAADERPSTPVRTEVTDSKHLLSPTSTTAALPSTTKKQRTMSTTTSPVTNPTGLPALQVKLLTPSGRAPTRGSEFAAGYDVYAARDTAVPARGKVLVDTDIAIAVPAGCYGRIAPRSGLASKNFIDTGAGVVDADYRGQVKILLFNHADTDFEIKAGDRVAQLILERIYTPDVVVVEELEESVRGAGGFGSTGN